MNVARWFIDAGIIDIHGKHEWDDEDSVVGVCCLIVGGLLTTPSPQIGGETLFVLTCRRGSWNFGRYLAEHGANLELTEDERRDWPEIALTIREWNEEVILTLLLLRKAAQENPLSGCPRDVVVHCLYDWLKK